MNTEQMAHFRKVCGGVFVGRGINAFTTGTCYVERKSERSHRGLKVCSVEVLSLIALSVREDSGHG